MKVAVDSVIGVLSFNILKTKNYMYCENHYSNINIDSNINIEKNRFYTQIKGNF